MQKYVVFFFLFFMILSCNKNHIKTPRQLLLKIYKLDQQKEYDEMKKYIYNVKSINSAELFISGVKKRRGTKKKIIVNGNFLYSPKALLYHAKYVNDATIPITKKLADQYLIKSKIIEKDSYIKRTLKKHPKNLLVYYPNGFTCLIFIRIHGQLKLLYSAYLTAQDYKPEKVLSDIYYDYDSKKHKNPYLKLKNKNK